ncbi:Uncharacterised protein [Mycobacteroides abscessus subsp. abscessus]|nr:Uncharacterised protein [Mycobacteroides abscessus subsp. abscessus]
MAAPSLSGFGDLGAAFTRVFDEIRNPFARGLSQLQGLRPEGL